MSEGPVHVVADGMGGHLAGAAASAAVIDAFRSLVTLDSVRPADVEQAIESAQSGVEELAASLGGESGSTLTGAIAVEHAGQPWWMIINIGDSRVYLLDGAELVQVTVDHSYVQELVDIGQLTPHEASEHPDRNIVTRAVGDGQRGFDAWLLPATPGQRLVIASDGLTTALTDARIAEIASLAGGPALAAGRLLSTALAADVIDNVTIVVANTLHAVTDPDADPSPWHQWGTGDMDDDDTTVAGRRRERV